MSASGFLLGPAIVPGPIPGYDFGMPSGFVPTFSPTPGRSASVLARPAIALLPFACLLALSACSSPPAFLREDIQSENPAHRIMAIRAAGEAGDARSVPLLVDRLEDEDRAVRFFAILALEKITGHRFGYDYAKPDADRRKAVQRWRTYVRRGEGVVIGDDEIGQEASGISAGSPQARRSPAPLQ